jgi:MYXO-CTERM domain-containing protein
MLWLALTAAAFAQRPTEGGMFAFDDTDVVVSLDDPSGRVRVHYSIEGPNVAKSTDADGDGVWDFPYDVAVTAADVLDYYDSIGLRAPVSEEEMGLAQLGGSYAFDFYLVDFAGNADGNFGQDRCTDVPYHCSGYMVMENDFKGYGYPDLHEAVAVLTSHELFHGVQAAYDAGQPVWFSEGTAVWGEVQYDPESMDFLWFAQAYLDDTGRSIDRPPTGPVPAFAYATGLFWDFLTLRHDQQLVIDILERTETTDGTPVDTLAEVEAALIARGDTLEDAWITFVSWNLATGDRAGAIEGYPYAADLDGITAEIEAGDELEDDNRFYPLAATYYHLEHSGGPLCFGSADDGAAVHFALHPVQGGAEDGPVGDAAAEWYGDAGVVQELGDLPAGGYWLVGTYPQIAAESTKVHFCLGDPADVEVCVPPAADTDTGSDDTGGGEDPGGCGCSTSSSGGSGAFALLALVVAARGRRPRS